MAEISRTALFGKLNPLAYKAIEGATVFCKLRGNPYVELQHWMQQILSTPDSDLHRIVRHFELDAGRHVHQQPVLPHRGVVRSQLVVRPDERAVVLLLAVERAAPLPEGDAVRAVPDGFRSASCRCARSSA